MVSFKCSDLEKGCCFETNCSNVLELNRQVIRHIHESHNVDVITADIMLKVKNSIRR
jgi:predicted small metal-binding protein